VLKYVRAGTYHELCFIVFYFVHLLVELLNVRKCKVWTT